MKNKAYGITVSAIAVLLCFILIGCSPSQTPVNMYQEAAEQMIKWADREYAAVPYKEVGDRLLVLLFSMHKGGTKGQVLRAAFFDAGQFS